MFRFIKEKYETVIKKKIKLTFKAVVFEKGIWGKADICGACEAAPASQPPAVAFCRQREAKQQEQRLSQLLCGAVRTAVKLSRIIWLVLLLLLRQSRGPQLKQAPERSLTAGGELREPFGEGLRTHRS